MEPHPRAATLCALEVLHLNLHDHREEKPISRFEQQHPAAMDIAQRFDGGDIEEPEQQQVCDAIAVVLYVLVALAGTHALTCHPLAAIT